MSINEVRYLPECGSTNAYMKEHFEEFGPVGAVYTTNQTADLARVIFDRIESGDYAGREGFYHFSNEGVCSWYDFAHEIAALAGHTSCKIRPCHSAEFPSKVQRPNYSVLDKTKIKTTFGIDIPHWRDSLVRCMATLR